MRRLVCCRPGRHRTAVPSQPRNQNPVVTKKRARPAASNGHARQVQNGTSIIDGRPQGHRRQTSELKNAIKGFKGSSLLPPIEEEKNEVES